MTDEQKEFVSFVATEILKDRVDELTYGQARVKWNMDNATVVPDLQFALQKMAEALDGLIDLARCVMQEANSGGAWYDEGAELSDARTALAAAQPFLEKK